jgi:hypothetical protein
MGDILRAAYEGDLDELERLVGLMPSLLKVTHDDDGATPLMLACEGGHVNVMRWLLDRGAAIHDRDCEGRTALHSMSNAGRLPVVRVLVERGADPTIANDYGHLPLHEASTWGRADVVRYLLALPNVAATINHRDIHGSTAISSACRCGHGEVVRLLLKQGADPTIPDDDGATPTAIAKHESLGSFRRSEEGRRDCAEALEVRVSFRGYLLPGQAASHLEHGGRTRSGPTFYGRPGRWRMRLGASRHRQWRRGRGMR